MREVDDVNDLAALEAAIDRAQREEERPSLIRVQVDHRLPVAATSRARARPTARALGEDEVRATKEVMGWDPDEHFLVPDGVYEHVRAPSRGAALQAEWNERFARLARRRRRPRGRVGRARGRAAAARRREALRDIDWGKDKLATRSGGPEGDGGVRDFVPDDGRRRGRPQRVDEDRVPGRPTRQRYTRAQAGRNVFFGVREHGMGGAVNGMAAHGGIVRPYGSTFLQFADYMRGSIRLSALTGLPVAWVYTHDSVGLGEDGPTHQPVEHLAALRAIPGLRCSAPATRTRPPRPGASILEDLEGPAALILSRQDLPVLSANASDEGVVARRLRAARRRRRRARVIVGDRLGGLGRARGRRPARRRRHRRARRLDAELGALRRSRTTTTATQVLPPELPTVSVEAGISMGW